MPNKSRFVCFAFLFLFGFAGYSNAQQITVDEAEVNGWVPGAIRDSVKAIKKRGKYQRLNRFEPLADSTSWMNVPLKNVRLYFFEGRLHSIELKAEGGANAEALFRALVVKFGKGEEMNGLTTQVEWVGSVNYMFYEQNLMTKDGMLTLINLEVHEKYLAYLKRIERGG